MTELRQTTQNEPQINIPRIKNIMSFLFEAGWTLKEHRKGRFIMKLPEKISTSNPDFCIYVVDSDDFEGYERTIEPIIKRTIPNIHGFNAEDFCFAMRNNGTIWTIAVESEAFHKKAIDIEHFMRMSIHIKGILKAVAEQVVLEKGGSKEMVEKYLQGCNLVKMDVEKLEVKMELPAELVFGFEQELLDEKEDKEEELEDELKEGELELVREEEIEYTGKKEWKSDVINQKLQEVFNGYSSFFKSEQKTAKQSKEEEIAALKSHLAVHDFIEEMALKQIGFSFFNKDYQKEFTLQIKEPLVEEVPNDEEVNQS